MSDANLLQQIQKGDSKAFESLYNKYKSAVLGLSYRILGASMLAEENAQDVWMKVINSAASFSGSESAKAWIMTITKNHALNIIKKRGWEEALPENAEAQIPDETEFQFGELSEYQKIENLKRAVGQLPDRQRVALVLWMNEEKSYSEIAQELGINVNACKVLLFRAKEAVKRIMEESHG